MKNPHQFEQENFPQYSFLINHNVTNFTKSVLNQTLEPKTVHHASYPKHHVAQLAKECILLQLNTSHVIKVGSIEVSKVKTSFVISRVDHDLALHHFGHLVLHLTANLLQLHNPQLHSLQVHPFPTLSFP